MSDISLVDTSLAVDTWGQLHFDMEIISALLAFCERNPSVADEFPSQSASSVEPLWFHIRLNKTSNIQPGGGVLRRHDFYVTSLDFAECLE